MQGFKQFNKRTALAFLSLFLIAIFSQGCSTVYRMQISQHTNSTPALTDARADAIAADMTLILQVSDGAGDQQCRVRFERDGNVAVFTTGTGIINNSNDFSTVIGLPGMVKVVNQINWCGALVPNVIGCAPVPGNSLAVVRWSLIQEGVLWTHEFGHNRGLNHRTDPTAVMNPVILTGARRVNAAECSAYR